MPIIRPDWRGGKRRGSAGGGAIFQPLQPPEAAIDPSEDAVSISAAMVLREQFAQDSPAVLAFFDALVELLTGSGRKH